MLPAGHLIGLAFALLLGGFLLLGRHPSSVIFVSLGTLTGSYAADRLARGWYYLGGQNGIPSIPPMTLGGYEIHGRAGRIYYLVLGILVVVYLLCRFLVRSQFGLALAGLRENEQRIAFFGYKAQHLKAIIFAIGGAIAGLAGSLYAFHEGFVWPNMVGVVVSTQVVLYVLFGGSGTLIGAVIGTVIVEGVSFWLSDNYRDIWPIISAIAAAAGDPVPAARPDQLRARRARAGRQLWGQAEGEAQCRSLKPPASARSSASSPRSMAPRSLSARTSFTA